MVTPDPDDHSLRRTWNPVTRRDRIPPKTHGSNWRKTYPLAYHENLFPIRVQGFHFATWLQRKHD